MARDDEKIDPNIAWEAIRRLLNLDSQRDSVIGAVERILDENDKLKSRRQQEERKAWDGYVRTLLRRGLVETSTLTAFADELLDYRKRKFRE